MKLVVQRVSSASVKVRGRQISRIGKGLFILVGIKKGDKIADADILANKLHKLRVMADDEMKMNLSVKDIDGEFLIVSQFTLYANTEDGNRPSFIQAADPNEAKEIYEQFLRKMKELGNKVRTGSFGEYMEIDANLDGPVTIILES